MMKWHWNELSYDLLNRVGPTCWMMQVEPYVEYAMLSYII